ncbi:hypothetical protein QYE76_038158 [Lolium multiflorum]|uniref:Reverse transcriptase zinc-binding domain-containing protein n=1 Tax=Lolium multiflorum TaxID=4521 RepID=A0AAD8WQW1_LOLMU|nr:hypothetical protein QYE76_038158 [Lolium multiflorum]
MLAHTMADGLLPDGVVEAIDKRRRAFLWLVVTARLPGMTSVSQRTVGGSAFSALLTKFLTKHHSDTPASWASWFHRRYGWNDSRDLGDSHHLDNPVWKDIAAGLSTFRAITKVSVAKGVLTAFWTDIWIGDTPLQDRFPNLFSHSARPNINVVVALAPDFRLSLAADTDLCTLANELCSVALRHDSPDTRWDRLTNKKLSNISVYTNSFRHLRIEEVAEKVWRSAAPLKCKVFCWLAWKKSSPTNERRFQHQLSNTAACLSCSQYEDTDHLLLTCPSAREFGASSFQTSTLGDPPTSPSRTSPTSGRRDAEATRKPPSAPPLRRTSGREETPGPSMASSKTSLLSPVGALRTLDFGPTVVPPPLLLFS